MHPHLVALVAERIGPDRLSEPHLAAIYQAMLEHGDAGFDAIQATLPAAAAELHVLLVQEEPPIISREATAKQVDEFLSGILAQLEVFDIDRQLEEIQAALKRAPDDQKDALTQQKIELARQRQQLSTRKFKVF